jgi:hypothetical protein
LERARDSRAFESKRLPKIRKGEKEGEGER